MVISSPVQLCDAALVELVQGRFVIHQLQEPSELLDLWLVPWWWGCSQAHTMGQRAAGSPEGTLDLGEVVNARNRVELACDEWLSK